MRRRKLYVAVISDFSYELEMLSPRESKHLIRGHDLICAGSITNTSGIDWNIVVDGVNCLTLGASFHCAETGVKAGGAKCLLDREVFRAGETRSFRFQLKSLE